ncbi:MerR HTH family regulatory protein [Paracoccus saliphilus]|nr:MerR HTH family regulatory protein [Paracoccus saliphilus]
MIGVAPHVLRYWETQFSQLKPMKRPDGRRYYRPEDVQLAAGLCEILREEGLTIRGAKKVLARDRGESLRARGMIRLGDAPQTGTAPDIIAAPATDTSDSALPQPDRLANEEPRKMANQRPKARPRKQKPDGAAQALPLFPDLVAASNDRDGIWLSRLVNTASRLRHADRLTVAAYRQCKQLRDAITRHY